MAHAGWSGVAGRVAALYRAGTAAGCGDDDLLACLARDRAGSARVEAAFRALLERHGGKVWAQCRRGLADRHAAEDAFQAVWLVLVRRARGGGLRLEGDEALARWLWGVGKKVVARARRDAGRRPAPVEGLESVVGAEPGSSLELRELIDRELARLPGPMRQAVELCLIDGLTHEQAAARLGWPIGTVRSRLARGRARLRDGLERRGAGVPIAILPAAGTLPPPPALAEATLALVVGQARACDLAHTAAARLADAVAPAASRVAGPVLVAVGLGLAGLAAAWGLVLHPGDGPTVPPHAAAVASSPARSSRTPTRGATAARVAAFAPAAKRQEAAGPGVVIRVVEAGTGNAVADARVMSSADAVEGRTEADGRTRVALPAEPGVGSSIAARVEVVRDGFAPIQAAWTADELRAGLPVEVTLALEPAETMGGRIVDDAGKPIAGVRVEPRFFGRGRGRNPSVTPFLSGASDLGLATDADGRWSCRLLPRDLSDADYLSIQLRHPDYVTVEGSNADERPALAALRAGRAESMMSAGVFVGGTVRDPGGEPEPGARVALHWNLGNGFARLVGWTDAAGRFAFPHSPADRPTWLIVRADGYPPVMVEKANGGAAPRTEGREYDLTLEPPGAPRRGRVVRFDGSPVAREAVIVQRWRGQSDPFEDDGPFDNIRMTTDIDGRFALPFPLRGPATLAVPQRYRAAATLPTSGPITYLATAELAEDADPSAEVVIRLPGPLRFSGTVADGATGAPSPRFAVRLGRVERDDGTGQPGIAWDGAPITWGHDGTYGTPPFETSLPHVVAIEAEGYRRAVSPVARFFDGPQTFDVKLQRESMIEGFVVGLDGKPAAGVRLLRVAKGDSVRLFNGKIKFPQVPGVPECVTIEDGRFALPRPEAGPFLIVAVDGPGQLLVSDAEFPPSGRLELKPWSSIRGVQQIGGKPNAGAIVQASRERAELPPGVELSIQFWGEADEHGRFTFERVPAGDYRVSGVHSFTRGRASFGFSADVHEQPVEVGPGQAKEVTIGGSGREVVGRFVMPEDADVALDPGQLGGLLYTVDEPPPTPPEFSSWTPERQAAWRAEFDATQAGRERARRSNRYGVIVRRDGSFRVQDVPPGRYRIDMGLVAASEGPGGAEGPEVVAEADATIDVPDGPRDVPADVGDVPVRVETFGAVVEGAEAPAFTATTLEGKPLALADLHGKLVLLDFWATWCGPCREELPKLDHLRRRLADDPRFALVGISIDDDPATARAFVAENRYDWTQAHLPPEDADGNTTAVLRDYGVQSIPATFLIGPDGRVIGRDLQGDRLRAAVDEALEAMGPR